MKIFTIKPICISKLDNEPCTNFVDKPGDRCHDCYQKIVNDGSVAARIALAQEANLPSATRRAIAQDLLPTVRAIFAARPDLSKEEESQLLSMTDEIIERALANNPYTSINTLTRLKQESKDPLTLSIIASRNLGS